MNSRTLVRLGRVIWAAAFGAQLAAFLFAFLTKSEGLAFTDALFLRISTYLPGLFAFATVGFIVVSRQTRNVLGWLLLGTGLVPAIGLLSQSYSRYVLTTRPNVLPFNPLILWLQALYVPSITLLGLILLMFPDGRLPSPRWRVVGHMIIALTLVSFFSALFKPGPFSPEYPNIDNPLAITSAGKTLDLLLSTALFVLLALSSLSGVAVVLRFRRAKGVERTQLKWFAYAAFLFMATTIVTQSFEALMPVWVVTLSFALVMAALPFSIGIAILRYRLFDIDILIRRTLIYGALTACLALFYFGSVIILQQLFRALTGLGSDLAIIVSTLAIAALFIPLRNYLQKVIDRRFYRRKYDAEKVLAAFAATVRDEVDLNQLTEELQVVVQETVQPEHVTLWLKAPTPSSKVRQSR